MSFISIEFFAFLLTALLAYYLLPKQAQWVVLLLASGVFYYFSGLVNFIFLFVSILTFYAGAHGIYRLMHHPFGVRVKTAKWLLGGILVLNICMLAVFKLSGTAGHWVAQLAARLGVSPDSEGLLLPLGISFYTFQGAGYLLDVYRGKVLPERNAAKFALFLSFFPQLVQGPISRFDQQSRQLTEQRTYDSNRFVRGAELMLFGFFKKLVIADNLAPFTSRVFADTQTYTGLLVALAAVLGTFQLYCDFSGGIDIARGVAEMFGIVLPENFRRPYFSRSIAEYWRRWHITLNEWWREYLFFPVTLSRPMNRLSRFLRKNARNTAGKMISVYLGISVVRLANALWHGIDFRHLASGLYFSIIMILALATREPLAKLTKKLRIQTESSGWRLFQMTRTFLLLCINRVLFMTDRFRSALQAWKDMFSTFNPKTLFDGTLAEALLTPYVICVAGGGLLVVLAISILQEKGISIRDQLNRKHIALRWAVLLAGAVAVFAFGKYSQGGAMNFLYARF